VEELPDALISDYAKMTTGLVPNVALASLAALREHTHLLLGKMNKDMDAPYLAHRVNLPAPDDAIEHLTNLISAELLSILEQAELGKESDIERIKQWLDSKQINYNDIFGPDITNWNEYILEVIEKGYEHKYENEEMKKKKESVNKKKRQSAIHFGGIEDNDRDFAILTTLKTHYSSPPPMLTLGQVVFDVAKDRYLICIQPLCDSVRIDKERTFLFLPLDTLPNDNNSKTNKDCYYLLDGTEYKKVKINTTSYQCNTIAFNSDQTSKKVIAIKDATNSYYFVGSDGSRFKWITQLKVDSAQDIVNQYAFGISRIGLNISEWIRR
jgi:hypothetical protein